MDRIEFRMRLGWNDDDSMCARAGAVEELGSRALIIADKVSRSSSELKSPLTPTFRLPFHFLTSSDIRLVRTLRRALSIETMPEKAGSNSFDLYLPSSTIKLRLQCWIDRIELRMSHGWNDDSMCARAFGFLASAVS
ncbi:hypothetical protein ACFX14_005375 [Malus domestica]